MRRFVFSIVLLLCAAGPATRPIDKFVKSTDQQNAKAIEHAEKVADDVQKSLELKLKKLETPNFLIYTDWEPAEYPFLQSSCENAYALVGKNFDLAPKDSIFVGKLSVFVFAKKETFRKYSRDYDQFPAGDV